MTVTLAAALCEPIDDDAPCGPDLDFDYDPEYSQFVARSDSILPQESFFDFNRATAKLPEECASVEALLQRSRDLRLLVLLAKFRILNRELAPFVGALEAMAALVDQRWDHVHPAGEDGDFGLRAVVIESLDDIKHVILPLQHAPLIVARRAGAISHRLIQVASGEITPREGENRLDRQVIEVAFAEAELADVTASRDLIARASAALSAIARVFEDRSSASTSLPRLEAALAKIQAGLDEVLVRRDPSAASIAPPAAQADGASHPGGAGLPPVAPSVPLAFADAAAVRGALAAAEGYFRGSEPSSPALLLVAQARQLVGKGLAEAVQLLVPNHASDAVINVGNRHVFELPIERLATLVEDGDGAGESEPSVPPRSVASRGEALDILQQVATHVRVREPSSPIPILCDRARALAERDFMSLLREMLPSGAFRNLDDD